VGPVPSVAGGAERQPPAGLPSSPRARRVIFDKLIQVLVFGCGDRRIAGQGCSATTLRRRRDEWIALRLAEHLHQLALHAYDRLLGLELDNLAVDGCITRRLAAARSPGQARWIAARRA
jgi:hypothetical protein